MRCTPSSTICGGAKHQTSETSLATVSAIKRRDETTALVNELKQYENAQHPFHVVLGKGKAQDLISEIGDHYPW